MKFKFDSFSINCVIGTAGELLIRAESVLANLSEEEAKAVDTANPGLRAGVYGSLRAAADLSPEVQDDLARHGAESFKRMSAYFAADAKS
jgi:hypothetical protein